ncbi:hypothetical protein IAU60_000031 [Kwoniella sp. DSM 27419]
MSKSLAGVLSTFQVGSYKYPIFTSGDLDASRAVVFIGGLTNGLGAVPFPYTLSDALDKVGWKLVQFHWSSAYGGYGTGSLDRDRQEMEALVKHLRSEGIQTIVVAGHSTGSQNVMHYLSNPIFQESSSPETEAIRVQGGIMQAPASDREFLDKLGCRDWFEQLPEAERLIKEGRGEDLLDKAFCKSEGMDVNAYRLHSLIGQGGDDDYFSNDVPDERTAPFAHSLSTSFGRLAAPALILYSDGDIQHQEGDVSAKLERWQAAAKGKLEYKLLVGASHDVCETEPQAVLCETVVEWLKGIE